jgi:hypothetical protein
MSAPGGSASIPESQRATRTEAERPSGSPPYLPFGEECKGFIAAPQAAHSGGRVREHDEMADTTELDHAIALSLVEPQPLQRPADPRQKREQEELDFALALSLAENKDDVPAKGPVRAEARMPLYHCGLADPGLTPVPHDAAAAADPNSDAILARALQEMEDERRGAKQRPHLAHSRPPHLPPPPELTLGRNGLAPCESCGAELASRAARSAHVPLCLLQRGSDAVQYCRLCDQVVPSGEMESHSRECLVRYEAEESNAAVAHHLQRQELLCLSDRQRRALAFVHESSRASSEAARAALTARFKALNFDEMDLRETVRHFRETVHVLIHLQLETRLELLLNDTHYRNLFETGKSCGLNSKPHRITWEDRIFNNIYHDAAPSERVKYGVLNVTMDPAGVRCCAQYGDSFLSLRNVEMRVTLASEDSSHSTVRVATLEHCLHVLHEFSDKELTSVVRIATKRQYAARSDVIASGKYKEVQIHGPIVLATDIEALCVSHRHRNDARIMDLARRFCAKNKCQLVEILPE